MKNNKKKTIIFVTLLIVVACLIIGYALLSTTLNILGNTTVSGNTWNIHWANIQVTPGSTTGNTKEATLTNPTKVEFNINLNEPGDFYEFTVDAVNVGTIDGMIDVISTNVYQSNGTTPTTLPSAITYYITYDDDTPLQRYELLPAHYTDTYKVRVEYKRDIENSELIISNQTYVIKVGIDYIQADENAVSSIPGVLPNYNASAGCANITTDSSGGGGNATMSGLTLMMKNATQGEDDPSWFTNTAYDQSQAGVYTRKGTSNDKYPIYYFRGAYESVNNNLIFNNYCWKIVRTTSTGGIRIIYNGPVSSGSCVRQTGNSTYITTASFNTSSGDEKYVKYVYDNNGTPTDSNLKTVLENWYNTNMSNVDNKIETSVYCNDTSELTTEDKSALDLFVDRPYYCSYKRGINATPTTLCSKKSDAYKLKVGFLTVDELVLAGRSWTVEMQDYLSNNGYYWLGAPYRYYTPNAYVYRVYGSNGARHTADTTANTGVRPVVTLLPNTSYTGTGTTTNPFVVN